MAAEPRADRDRVRRRRRHRAPARAGAGRRRSTCRAPTRRCSPRRSPRSPATSPTYAARGEVLRRRRARRRRAPRRAGGRRATTARASRTSSAALTGRLHDRRRARARAAGRAAAGGRVRHRDRARAGHDRDAGQVGAARCLTTGRRPSSAASRAPRMEGDDALRATSRCSSAPSGGGARVRDRRARPRRPPPPTRPRRRAEVVRAHADAPRRRRCSTALPRGAAADARRGDDRWPGSTSSAASCRGPASATSRPAWCGPATARRPRDEPRSCSAACSATRCRACAPDTLPTSRRGDAAGVDHRRHRRRDFSPALAGGGAAQALAERIFARARQGHRRRPRRRVRYR